MKLAGIVYDLDEETYHAHPALSSTGARQLLDAPARFEYARSVPQEPRKAFDVGTAAHSKVLGAGATVVAIPEGMLASNGAASTAAAKQFIADARAAGEVPVKQAELDAVNLMAEAVLGNPDARRLLEQDGHPEASVFATDPVLGVEVRCRFDWLAAIGVDLKTSAKKATRAQFERTVMDYGYHIQQAHYEDTYEFAGGHLEGFTFVVVEKEPPHLVGVFVLDADFREMGRTKAAEARRRFADGIETGIWPGYPQEIQIVRPPQWAIAAHVKEARVA